MYNTGVSGFPAAASSYNRTIDTKVVVNAPVPAELGTGDIVSYKATYAAMGDKAFVPGSFVASQLELSLNAASDAVSAIDFKTANIANLALSAGVEVSSKMVYVPMGVFYISKDGVDTSSDGYVSISATDIPEVLLTEFNSSTLPLPCTIEVALESMSDAIGIPLYIEPELYSGWPFINLQVVLSETFTLTCTYRQAFMYMAEALGAYVSMGRNGEICFKPLFNGFLADTFFSNIDDNYLFSVSKQESSVKPIQNINIKANKDDLGVTASTGRTGVDYDILDNPLTYGYPEDFLEGLVDALFYNSFYPSKISFQGRPDLDTCDWVKYSYKGQKYPIPVCIHVFEYNGGFKSTVESVGSSQKNVSSHDSGIKTQIVALRQQINSLVRDLTKTQSTITDINGDIVNISSMLQTAVSIGTRLESLEGDVGKFSAWTQTAEGFRIDIGALEKGLSDTKDQVNENQEKLMTYFEFQQEGIVIGAPSSSVKLRLANNRISFLRDSQEVAYMSDGQLYITDAHFLNSLVLGNFEFKPRNNGNLSLIRRS